MTYDMKVQLHRKNILGNINTVNYYFYPII